MAIAIDPCVTFFTCSLNTYQLVWPVPLARVLPRPQLIFPSKTQFFGIHLNFQLQKPIFKSISPTFLNPDLTKQIPLNPAHQDLSNRTKGTLQLLRNFQLQFNLIFSEEIIQYSRTFARRQVQTSWNQPYALLLDSFPKRPRTRSEASQFNGSHNYKTKQTTFLHRQTSVACAIGQVFVIVSSTDFSFRNLLFWNLFEFSAAKIT